MPLVSLVYVSSATRQMAPAELTEILAKSRHNNARHGITGMLLHKDGNFMQVLEGKQKKILSLFDTIGRDPRHNGVLVLRNVEQAEREFSEWSMAFTDLNDPKVRAIPGYSEFLNTPLTGQEIRTDPSLCHKLLLTFKRTMQLSRGV